ncbi:MAG TPA: hypothetical protein VKU83_02480 [Puia sp.]|nr:hypothetical protein [Puia sp.]
MNRNFRPRKIARIITMVIVGILGFSLIVMLLWNALMPDIFGMRLISYWQALGLLILSKILFTGMRGGPGRGWRKEAIRDKWANMTPEERERFKEEWSRRCGKPFTGNPPGAPTQA